MLLRIPADQRTRLRFALAGAGKNEIGGQLFGEQLAPAEFAVTDLTVQRRRGTFARFFVDLLQTARDAARFFERTGRRYEKFNYIGEWHSHPSFEVRPSAHDVATMRGLVSDVEFRGNFAVLLIVRLDREDIAMYACVFDPKGGEMQVTLENVS